MKGSYFSRTKRAAVFLVAALAVSAFLGSCASIQKRPSGDSAEIGEKQPEEYVGRPEAEPGDRVVGLDVNRDGNPNIYHHYRVGSDGSEQLIRRDIDLNGNGKIDVWRFYEDGERLVKEAFDLDFDGVVDVWNFFDDRGRLIRKEADLSLNGQTDLWKYYENGKLVRKERDTSGNGRADYFEFWEGGEIDRVGEDLNGDGTVDRWTRRARG